MNIAALPAATPSAVASPSWALSAFAGRVYVASMSLSASDYRPRDAEHAVLYRVIDKHRDAFLEAARRHADGASIPAFVEQEFRDFLTCGVLAHGFARLRCTDCALEEVGCMPSCRPIPHIALGGPATGWCLPVPCRAHSPGIDRDTR